MKGLYKGFNGDALPPDNLQAMADKSSEAPLPNPVSFDSPPVYQVILGVEFTGPIISEAAALADFWNEIRDEFSEVERQAPLAPMAETFDVQPQQPQFEFRLGPGGRAQRYLFRNPDEGFAIQVQEDRFAFSWERLIPDQQYPRYSSIRERFQEIYATFIKSADEQLLAEHSPSWCATTYTNEIVHPDSEDPLSGPLEDILCFLSRPDSEVLPPVEDTMVRQRRLLRDAEGEPRGRLYIQSVPALTPPPQLRPAYDLTLRVVAKPLDSSNAGVFSCQDENRDLIVRSFKDITTDKMHRVWGLRKD
jgi:uncharacterized protein (TIGR04255 family)